MEVTEIICSYCSKEFCNKMTLLRHQTTTKSCLKLQGKQEVKIDCINCKKSLAVEYYKQHKIKCDIIFEKSKTEQKQEFDKIQKQNKKLSESNDKLKLELYESKRMIDKLNKDIYDSNDINNKLKIDLAEARTAITILEHQNDRLHSSSTSVTMKLVEKANTVNNTNNNTSTVVINTNQLTNDVLRQCANTFHMDHATGINGIAKHLTSSLEEHITCTDPSRNIFKYTNEKDEEIIDQNLEILLPQYLTAVKDRNDFLYKEVFEYFKKNNVSLNVQTDYS